MSVLVLVVDDEPDVEALFRQQFRLFSYAQVYKYVKIQQPSQSI